MHIVFWEQREGTLSPWNHLLYITSFRGWLKVITYLWVVSMPKKKSHQATLSKLENSKYSSSQSDWWPFSSLLDWIWHRNKPQLTQIINQQIATKLPEYADLTYFSSLHLYPPWILLHVLLIKSISSLSSPKLADVTSRPFRSYKPCRQRQSETAPPSCHHKRKVLLRMEPT